MKKIFFYVHGLRHFERAQLLSNYLSSYKCSIFTNNVDLELKCQVIEEDALEEYLNKNDSIIILFSAFPDLYMLKLLMLSYVNEIPTVGIEESCQLMLSHNKFFNYLSPINCLVVSSKIEKQLCEKMRLGYEDKVYYSSFFLEENRTAVTYTTNNKVLLVCLSVLNIFQKSSSETISIRKKLFKVLHYIQKKHDYEIRIKPHPLDNIEFLKHQLDCSNVKNVILIDKEESMKNILNDSEIILTYGDTQVLIEALYLKKNILIFKNKKSIFEDGNNIIRTAGDVANAILYIQSDEYKKKLDKLFQIHFELEEKLNINNIIKDSFTISKNERELNNINLLISVQSVKDKSREVPKNDVSMYTTNTTLRRIIYLKTLMNYGSICNFIISFYIFLLIKNQFVRFSPKFSDYRKVLFLKVKLSIKKRLGI